MEVILYTYSGEQKKVNKLGNLQIVKTINDAKPYNPLSALTGELILDNVPNILNANYAKFLDKYYFILPDKELLPGEKVKFKCRTDVLQTYCNSAAFNSVKIVPQRSASYAAYNAWVADGQQPVEVAKYCQIMNPTGYDPALPDACLNYGSMSLVAGIIGTEDKIGTTVQTVQSN